MSLHHGQWKTLGLFLFCFFSPLDVFGNYWFSINYSCNLEIQLLLSCSKEWVYLVTVKAANIKCSEHWDLSAQKNCMCSHQCQLPWDCWARLLFPPRSLLCPNATWVSSSRECIHSWKLNVSWHTYLCSVLFISSRVEDMCQCSVCSRKISFISTAFVVVEQYSC